MWVMVMVGLWLAKVGKVGKFVNPNTHTNQEKLHLSQVCAFIVCCLAHTSKAYVETGREMERGKKGSLKFLGELSK